MSYHGYTYCLIPQWLLPLWRGIFCSRGWHLWDEVSGLDEHYLHCDACEIMANLKD